MDILYTFWLAERALWFMGLFWPVTLFAVGLLAFAAAKTFFWDKRPFQKRLAVPLLPALTIPFFLVWGTIFEDQPRADAMISTIFYSEIALMMILVVRMKGLRLYTAAMCFSILWLSACCMVVAVMSVTRWWSPE